MDQDTMAVVTFATAVLGAVLGVFNAWRAWLSDRPRLRLRVAHAFGAPFDRMLMLEVVNLSGFPVTVTALGFNLRGSAQHVVIQWPTFTQGEKLPVRLEPRAACTALMPLGAFQQQQLARIELAYVRTACGLEVKAGRNLLRQLRHAAAAG